MFHLDTKSKAPANRWFGHAKQTRPGSQAKKLRRSIEAILISIAATAIAVLVPAQHAFAAGAFTCSPNFYQVISGQLKVLDPNTGLYTDIGTVNGDAKTYNGIAYNVADDYIYGLNTDSAIDTPPNSDFRGHLIRIDNDGVATDLGVPTGLPAPSSYNNAGFDGSGNMIVRASDTTWYSINVSTVIATTLTIDTSAGTNLGADLVVVNNGTDDIAYSANNNTLYRVNLGTNATLTPNAVTGLPVSGPYGAAWADSSDNIYFSDNADGSIYRIDNYTTGSPSAVKIVTGITTGNNDGTSCPTASPPFIPPVATDDSASGVEGTTISGDVIANDTGTAITVTSNTNPSHGTVTVNADGSYDYTPEDGFTGVDSFTYTITDSLSQSDTATVTLTVTADVSSTTAAAAASTIAQTGNEIGPVMGLGAILTLGGFILVTIALLRRRRFTH